MIRSPAMPAHVAVAFERLPKETHKPLRILRDLIFEEAMRLGVGPITETLKWGEPSYLTEKSRSGTTIRFGHHDSKPGHYAVFFHCQTTMVSDIRKRFGDSFLYQGNRAVFACVHDAVARDRWRECFEMALLYKRRARR